MIFLKKTMNSLLLKSREKFPLALPLIESLRSFVFSTDRIAEKGVFIRCKNDVKRMMSLVIVALFPCVLTAIVNLGLISTGSFSFMTILHGLLKFMPAYMTVMTAGGLTEYLFAYFRKKDIEEGFLVTGLIFTLILPPDIPLWQAAAGIVFGVVFAKEIFGGTGRNIFNPAITARVFLTIAFPRSMSQGYFSFYEHLPDAIAKATPLTLASSESTKDILNIFESQGIVFSKIFTGIINGAIGETSVLACLLGAFILLFFRVASVWLMAGFFSGAIFFYYLIFYLSGPCSLWFLPLSWHLCLGGLAFAGVFMITDPVTAPSAPKGQFIYAFIGGALGMTIRLFNPSFPEGVSFAILTVNIIAPLIDELIIKIDLYRWKCLRKKL